MPWWLVILCAFAVFWDGGCRAEGAVAESAPLTRFADIRRLSRDQAAKAVPVRITGVIVWQESTDKHQSGEFIVNDGENGIWVGVTAAFKRGLWPRMQEEAVDLEPGWQVEIEGVTDPAGYAPIVLPTHVRRIGPAQVPTAARIPLERLLSGADDGRLVVMEGVIQDLVTTPERQIIYLMTNGNMCHVIPRQGAKLNSGELVDARVRISGVFTPVYNFRSEAVGLQMRITGMDAIEVLNPPPQDPFQAPKISISSIFQFSPDAAPYQRKVTEGTVIFSVPGEFFFLQNGQSSVRVASNDKSVKPGQQVEVAGFVDKSGTFAAMMNALVRQRGTTPVPVAQDVTVGRILSPIIHEDWGVTPSYRDFNGRLVRVKGYLRRVDWNAPLVPKTIRVESDGFSFYVNLPGTSVISQELANTWSEGAEIELSGICELEFKGNEDALFRPSGFHLLLGSPNDFHIVRQPPWWNAFRLGMALGGVGLAVILLLAWTWTLRKQVERQSHIIGDKIRAEATHEERSRIARDLHDSIEQQLAGVSLHLYGARAAITSDPGSAAVTLDQARRMLKHTQRETRSSIRGLRSPLLEGRSLANALEIMADETNAGGGPHVEIRSTGSQPLSPDNEFQLLRIAQEALSNALKHAGAQKILITIDSSPQDIILSIIDDGCGFRPDDQDISETSHFGLLGMRERAIKLGAHLSITSEPGKGCNITVRIPVSGIPDATPP